LVCHLLDITDIDPLRHGLRFERFLHAGRESLPDIDLDFASQIRPKLLAWVVKRFGGEHVARVGSLSTYQPRSALRAALLAHGWDKDQEKAIGREIDENELKADDGLTLAPSAWPFDPELWPKAIDDARELLDRPQEWGSHPSGIVLTAKPCDELIPCEKAT